MQEPIEAIIIRVQQNFEIVGGLNPVQIEIEDDRVVNMLKNHKNVACKLTPLRILFPVYGYDKKNDTEHVFITCRALNDVKEALINNKSYGLF